MRCLRIASLPAALFVSCWAANACADALKNLDRDEWMGIYVGSHKLGYLHTSIRRDNFKGDAVYHMERALKIRYRTAGTKYEMRGSYDLYVNSGFSPIFAIARTCGGIRDGDQWELVVQADYEKMTVEEDLRSSGGESLAKRDKLPHGMKLAPGCMYDFGVTSLSVGDTIELSHLRWRDAINSARGLTALFSTQRSTLRAERRERVHLGGRSYDALVVCEKDAYAETWKWIAGNRGIIKTENNTGVVLVRQSQEDALEGLDGDGPDLSPFAPVDTDGEIADPSSVVELKVKLLGFRDKSLLKSDDRQTVVFSPNTKTAQYHIVARRFPAWKSRSLPIGEEEYAKWLEDDEYLQVSHELIQQQAREIVGSESSAYQAACKVNRWVYKNIASQRSPDARSIRSAKPRTATEILKEKHTGCKYLAVLYTALARAAGIPTRIVTGLAYSERAFHGHAWAESFVGEWVAFDPGYFSNWVPAILIKMWEGDPVEAFVPTNRWRICDRAEIVECWPVGITPTNIEHSTTLQEAVIIRRIEGILAFPPGTRVLTVPKSGRITDDPGGKSPVTYTGSPGSLISISPAGYHYVHPPGSRVITLAQACSLIQEAGPR